MKTKTLLIALLLSIWSGLFAEKQYLSIGYIPYWSYSCYTTLDYSALTHLNFAFCNPNTNGDLSAGISDTNLRAIITKAHQNDVKVMASLGGAGYSTNYPALISTAAARTAFCDKIIAYAKKYEFDGVDLDIEGEVANSFWTYYEDWVAELRTKCTENGLLLTTAVGQWYGDKMTNKTFTYFDFVTIMEYHRKANNYPTSINYWVNTKKIPANKLVLGVPFYGYKNGNYLAYKDVVAANSDAWYVNSFDDYTYHNPADIAAIAQLSKNYYGIMIWELSQDVPGNYSLLKAVKNVLYEGGNGIPEIAVPVTNVVLLPSILEVTKGRLGQFNLTIEPENSTLKTVKWTSAKPAIATVNNQGVIKGVTVGNSLITVASIDGVHSMNSMVKVIDATTTNGFFPDTYYFRSLYSDKMMEIVNRNSSIGARLQQGELLDSDNAFQQWKFELKENDTYFIKSKLSGYYLAVLGIENGSKINLQNFNGTINQQWRMTEIAPDVFTVISVAAERALDVSGPSVANGAEVHIWAYADGKNQQWRIEKVQNTGGLEKLNNVPNYKLYYQTDNILAVAFQYHANRTYKMYSTNGALVKSGNLNQEINNISIFELSAGIYTIEINDGKQISCEKIIKK